MVAAAVKMQNIDVQYIPLPPIFPLQHTYPSFSLFSSPKLCSFQSPLLFFPHYSLLFFITSSPLPLLMDYLLTTVVSSFSSPLLLSSPLSPLLSPLFTYNFLFSHLFSSLRPSSLSCLSPPLFFSFSSSLLTPFLFPLSSLLSLPFPSPLLLSSTPFLSPVSPPLSFSPPLYVIIWADRVKPDSLGNPVAGRANANDVLMDFYLLHVILFLFLRRECFY